MFLWLQNSRTKSRRGWDGLIVCIVCDIECCLLPCYVMRASSENNFILKLLVPVLCLGACSQAQGSSIKKWYRAGALMLILVEVSGRPQRAYPDANPPLLSKNGLFDGRIELKARCLIDQLYIFEIGRGNKKQFPSIMLLSCTTAAEISVMHRTGTVLVLVLAQY